MECKIAFYVIQAHHDFCPHDTLLPSHETALHDWEAYCNGCEIQRPYDANLPMCPAVDCSNAAPALAALQTLTTSCTGAECCGDAATQEAFQLIYTYHEDCDHDDVPQEVEQGLHAYEHACEDHLCNTVNASYDGTVCVPDDHDDHDHGHGK